MHSKDVTSLTVSPKDIVTKILIGKVIREARESCRLKQLALAAQLGLKSNSYLNQIERGKMVPSLDMAQRIEQALDLPHNSVAILVLKYRLSELTAMLLHEANERGININVRLSFNS